MFANVDKIMTDAGVFDDFFCYMDSGVDYTLCPFPVVTTWPVNANVSSSPYFDCLYKPVVQVWSENAQKN